MLLFHFWVIEMQNVNGIVIVTWICVEILSGIETSTLTGTLNVTCVVASVTVIWNVIVIWIGGAVIVHQSETWSEIAFWIWSGFLIENEIANVDFPKKQNNQQLELCHINESI